MFSKIFVHFETQYHYQPNGAADKPPAGDPRSGTEAGRLHPHDGQREAASS